MFNANCANGYKVTERVNYLQADTSHMIRIFIYHTSVISSIFCEKMTAWVGVIYNVML